MSTATMTERRALTELNRLVQDYINSKRYNEEVGEELGEERIPLLTNQISSRRPIYLWGVPLLQDERTDVILLKFLEETRFSVRDSFTMIKNTLRWRTGFGVDYYDNNDNINDDGYYTSRGEGYFRHGTDREGRPVCYCWIRNYFPESSYTDEYVSDSMSSRMAKRCTRSWILSLERMIRQLVDFRRGGVNAIFLVNDINCCSLEMTNKIKNVLPLLHQYYPHTIAFQVFINKMPLGICDPLRKSKLLTFDIYQTLDAFFKYISPDQVPIRYGGLSTDSLNNVVPIFNEDDPPAELYGLDSSKSIRITTSVHHDPIRNDCLHFWELRVVSSKLIVSKKCRYSVEFVPKSGGRSNIISVCEVGDMKCKGVVSGGYKATSPGSLVFLVINLSGFTRVVFRHKVVPQPEDREPSRYFRCPNTGKMYTKS